MKLLLSVVVPTKKMRNDHSVSYEAHCWPMNAVRRFVADETAATAVEYCLIATGIQLRRRHFLCCLILKTSNTDLRIRVHEEHAISIAARPSRQYRRLRVFALPPDHGRGLCHIL
jgi:hypothetical protein